MTKIKNFQILQQLQETKILGHVLAKKYTKKIYK
jgi:hypothetical protein